MRHALVVAAVMFSSTAHADVTRCSTGDAAVAYATDDLPTQSGDTGWFPSGSVAQLRLSGEIVGKTTVGMGLAPTACWHHGMTIATPGEGKTGMLDVEYGAALHLYGQIHTSVLGHSIDWSSEIPIPFIPSDLLLAGTTTFDPILLPDSIVTSASVSDTISPITMISSNVLGDIIDITGISGGLYVTVQGAMTSTYRTTSVAIAGGAITSATGTTELAAPTSGYGAMLTPTAAATGTMHYAPSLVFAANFDVKILGVRVVNWQIASISMPLSAIDRPVALTGAGAQIGLPHIDTVPQQLGFAGGASQPLQLHNGGAAPLMIELASGPDGVTAAAVTIAPGADGIVQVTAADAATVASAPLVLTTNDPNHSTFAVTLDPSTTGQTDPSGEPSGGCNTGGGSSGALMIVLVGLVAKRRRLTA